MSAFEFLICGGLTAAGLVLSYFRFRRRGARSGTRFAAFSLLPLAAYLSGTVTLITRISSAVVRFAGSFVFSPERWSGIVLAGVAAAMLLVSGGIPLTGRKGRKARRVQAGEPGVAGPAAAGSRAQIGAGSGKVAKRPKRGAPAADDDLGDVEEILRRRGIK
jgi:hypothetical protein